MAVNNLVDLIIQCIDHPAATNQIFRVLDDGDISTAELLRKIGKTLARRARQRARKKFHRQIVEKLFRDYLSQALQSS